MNLRTPMKASIIMLIAILLILIVNTGLYVLYCKSNNIVDLDSFGNTVMYNIHFLNWTVITFTLPIGIVFPVIGIKTAIAWGNVSNSC